MAIKTTISENTFMATKMMHELLIVLALIGFFEYSSGEKRPVKVNCSRTRVFLY